MTLTPSDYLSMLAIGVSLLALPVSYIVSTQQVKTGLDEHDRMVRNRTRLIVANRLDCLQSIFFSAAQVVAGYNQGDDQTKLSQKIEQIESSVLHTGILTRLAKSIDDYEESGDFVFLDPDLMNKLQMVRGLIDMQSGNPGQHTGYKIIEICQGKKLQDVLRAISGH